MRPWQRELLIFLGFCALSLAITWPLAQHFATEIGGDFGDHWQTLWGMWWVKKALVDLHQSPFFSAFVHWPLGTPLYFETFDLPDCLLAIPLWALLPSPVAVFNTVELWSYPLAGYFFYRFALELLHSEAVGDDSPRAQRAAAVAAGALFTFAPYHLGHALGHMHLVTLEWVPLYFWMLLKTFGTRERRWPIFAALALAAAATASWYYLLFCVVLTLPYLVYRPWVDREARTLGGLRQAVLLGAAFLALLWPLFSAMLDARAAEAWDGAHDPVTFSADLYELFIPNKAQSLGTHFLAQSGRWSGNPAENCDYLGYALLALALLGAFRSRGARLWLGTAALGALLALGPYLHEGGEVHRDHLLPYGALARALPLLEFTGCPVRAGFIAIFALAAAAAFGLAALFRKPQTALVGAALLGLAAFEFWPIRFVTSRFPIPAIFARWAADPTPFAVADYTGDTRPLYNGVLHQHPMVDIYLSRTPVRLLRWLDEHPVLGRLRHQTGQPLALSKADARQLLRQQEIRYFVMPDWRRDPTLERDLELPTVYVGEGVRVYEVPAGE